MNYRHISFIQSRIKKEKKTRVQSNIDKFAFHFKSRENVIWLSFEKKKKFHKERSIKNVAEYISMSLLRDLQYSEQIKASASLFPWTPAKKKKKKVCPESLVSLQWTLHILCQRSKTSTFCFWIIVHKNSFYRNCFKKKCRYSNFFFYAESNLVTLWSS